jgi:hypothetical protein
MANGAGDYSPADFIVAGRSIEYVGNRSLPFVNEEDLIVEKKTEHSIANYRDGKRFVLFSEGHFFHDRQLLVDYATREPWSGPVPVRQSLPGLTERIQSKRPIAVALLGDSISTGANASGMIGVYPFLPPFYDVFIDRLKAVAGGKVDFSDYSLGGKTSAWGLTQIDRVIAGNPDLILIAFGMNDASGRLTAEKFKSNIQMTMDAARRALPRVEFVLISGMSANAYWNKANPERHLEYGRVLAGLAMPGVAVCDVESVWDYAVERKGFWSMTGNGVNHPNDFGHRIYADCLTATVIGWPH